MRLHGRGFRRRAFDRTRCCQPCDRAAEHDSHVKSGYSDSEGGARVEVARSGAVHVRDSKAAPSGPELRIATPAWAAVVSAVRPEA
ncbi:DUF397 domain-containing protein [Streptomyces albogriseolus]|uniref:DUF397 domain-containing protein n=1 Tax=Streptomyces albogriseolus TaxID=1887 RepID=UPI0037F49907